MTESASIKTTLSLKDFLSKPKGERPRILLEQEATLEIGDITLTAVVRQLTKAQYETFNKRIQGDAPQVPLVDVVYTQAHRDPNNPQKIRPAGTYKERDEKDPQYLKDVQEWFTSACIMLAVFSAAESLGINPEDLPAINEMYLKLSFEIPGPVLLEFALAAASVNPGIAIAEELLKQDMLRQQKILAEMELARAEAEALEAEERAQTDLYRAAEKRHLGISTEETPPSDTDSAPEAAAPAAPEE